MWPKSGSEELGLAGPDATSAPLAHYPRVRFVSPSAGSRLGCFSSRVNPGTFQPTSGFSLRFSCKSGIEARRGPRVVEAALHGEERTKTRQGIGAGGTQKR
ncbi:hypothetical protein CT0861_13261 [Colletotrichum tofieldiae]|uniref:Uncharacterized protein n=1 Tax=Colletotrichum tofieldiae TaxID=708197 RepID=A0A166RTD8_9PEZI|nr:hypothetical protein CT0861_13261 [Colletotrichum tofieldiae]